MQYSTFTKYLLISKDGAQNALHYKRNTYLMENNFWQMMDTPPPPYRQL